MSIVLVQLGDIHFRNAEDEALRRAAAIGSTIAAEVASDTREIVLALCGDSAYSGTAEQFLLARTFVESIEAAIRQRFPAVKLTRVMIPGNHDCSFSGDQAARDSLLATIRESEKPAPSIANIILAPLSDYFDFATQFAGEPHAITHTHPFYQSVDIPDNGATLRLHLLNTAWMSSLHEQPGSLQFPLAEIVPPAERADISFAMLHHPTHWFSQPHAMRPLRDRVATIASAVLVNHEHVAEATEHSALMNRDPGATRTLYVAGGVIQEPGQPHLCTFNILKIDVAAKSVYISRHEVRTMNGAIFFERSGEDLVDLSRNELNVGPAGASLTNEMAAFLDDPGAPVTHPRRDPRIPIRLFDIFLYPDLWELDSDHDGKDQKQIKSAKVAEEVLGTERTLITGGEKSGRTSIIKSLFRAAFDAGRVPLLLEGADIPNNKDRLRKVIRKKVKEQYVNLAPEQFEQLQRSDRVVLVDDLQQIGRGRVRKELLAELELQFGTIVLCGDDLTKMEEVTGADARDSGLWEYRHLVILGFGEYLREEFVRKWLMLGGDTAPDDDVLEAEVDRMCNLLDVVIKRQLLPPYPLFLLVVLQQSDLANASVQSGSFGKLFEGVVTAILNKSAFNRINIGDKHYYLAAMSKRMYDGKAMSLSVEAAKEWHREYWAGIELDIGFDTLVADLESLGILARTNAEIRFKYAYFFCFFLAYHLNRTLHQRDTRDLVTQLCQQLHHNVSADIVLFLAHLTGDPIVLDEMVNTCEKLFADVAPASLELDVEPLNRIGNVIETIAISDRPDENRRKLRLEKDAQVVERLAATRSTHEVVAPQADNDAIRRLFDLHAAYKTIQILGQALRNIGGSATKARKQEVIEKIIGLTRRLLGSYLQLFAGNVLPQIIEDLAAAHKEQNPDLATSEIQSQVCRHLTGLSQFVCFATIKHMTFSVGSENLAPTIHRLLQGNSDAIARLMDLSFDLERPRNFPKDAAIKLFDDLSRNRFSASLVRILVAHHMYLYVVPVRERQAVSQKLGIKLLPTVLDESRKRLT